MESVQSEDAKVATAYRAPEGPDLHRAFWEPPTQGRRDPTLNAEREPPEDYGDTLRRSLGVEAGKGRSRRGQEHLKEEAYGSRRPALDQQEHKPKADWPRMARGRRQPGFRPTGDPRPPARPPIPRTRDHRGKHNNQEGEPGGRNPDQGCRTFTESYKGSQPRAAKTPPSTGRKNPWRPTGVRREDL